MHNRFFYYFTFCYLINMFSRVGRSSELQQVSVEVITNINGYTPRACSSLEVAFLDQNSGPKSDGKLEDFVEVNVRIHQGSGKINYSLLMRDHDAGTLLAGTAPSISHFRNSVKHRQQVSLDLQITSSHLFF